MKKKLIIIGVLAIVATIATVGIIFLLKVNNYQNTMSEMKFSNIDISSVPDGVYIGECDADLIYAKVEVTVKDGTLAKIVLLEHRNGRGSTAEGIEQRIVEQQRIEVDAVSGATNSSKVIMKAVDNALNSGG